MADTTIASTTFKQLTAAGWPEEIVQQYTSKRTSSLSFSSLKMEGISKTFNHTLALNHIDLTLSSGELLGIAGINGAGKSTLLYILAAFLEPDAGDVILTLKNQPPVSITKNPQLIKPLIGFSPQKPALYPRLTSRENLAYFAALYGLTPLESTERAQSLLALTELTPVADFLVQDLPPVLQRKLDIACAIIHTPVVLILDEPTIDVDPLAAEDIWKLITTIRHQGSTIIIASHFFDALHQHCTRVLNLNKTTIADAHALSHLEPSTLRFTSRKRKK